MRIKKVTPYLKIKDVVRAVVRECLDNGHLIVSFEGDLLNVKNKTQKRFRAGDVIALQVEALNPLGFKMLAEPVRLRDTSWKA